MMLEGPSLAQRARSPITLTKLRNPPRSTLFGLRTLMRCAVSVRIEPKTLTTEKLHVNLEEGLKANGMRAR